MRSSVAFVIFFIVFCGDFCNKFNYRFKVVFFYIQLYFSELIYQVAYIFDIGKLDFKRFHGCYIGGFNLIQFLKKLDSSTEDFHFLIVALVQSLDVSLRRVLEVSRRLSFSVMYVSVSTDRDAESSIIWERRLDISAGLSAVSSDRRFWIRVFEANETRFRDASTMLSRNVGSGGNRNAVIYKRHI